MLNINAAADKQKAIQIAKYKAMSSKELASLSENTKSDAYPGSECKGVADFCTEVSKQKNLNAAKIKSLRSKPII